MDMQRWKGKTAIVTGAASGIGAAITRALLQNGVNVAGFDVQIERLKQLGQEMKKKGVLGEFYPVHCDLSDSAQIEDAFKSATKKFDGVDIMVNNAGVVNFTRIIDSDRKTFEKLLNINVLAFAVCTNIAIRSMRQRNVEGHVINVNSILGRELPEGIVSEADGLNGWNLYPTSKHGSVALTHSVRREVAAIKAPIRITSVCPGFVNTNLCESFSGLETFFENVKTIKPEDVADAMIYALGTRPEVQISELIIQPTGAVQ